MYAKTMADISLFGYNKLGNTAIFTDCCKSIRQTVKTLANSAT